MRTDNSNQSGCCRKDEYIYELLERYLRNEPDVLKVCDVCRITGYCRSGMKKWIETGKIKAFKNKGDYIIAKSHLIEYMASDYYMKSRRSPAKSRLIIETIGQKLMEEMHSEYDKSGEL